MRFNEALCYSMPPIHIGLQNNNQLQRSSSEILINAKEESLTLGQENQEFRLGQDTSTYSLQAVINRLNEHNNNLDSAYPSSSTESLPDLPDLSAALYNQEISQDLSDSDWSIYSEDANLPAGCRGIVNPNYPGFQHLGPSLLSDTDDTDDEPEDVELQSPVTPELETREDEFNNNNNNNNNNNDEVDETINRFDAQIDEQKQLFYEKPKFNLQSVSSLIECMNYVKSVRESGTGIFGSDDVEIVQLTTSVKESLQFPEIAQIPDSSKNSEAEEIEDGPADDPVDLIREANCLNPFLTDLGGLSDSNGNEPLDMTNVPLIPELVSKPASEIEAASRGKLEEIDLLASIGRRSLGCHGMPERQQRQASVPDVVAMELDVQARCLTPPAGELFKPAKHEKMLRNQRHSQPNFCTTIDPTTFAPTNPFLQDIKNKAEQESGSFDVYNIETAMPKIDMDAIETHLKAAREEERRRRNDREEIRRRLAMGPDAEETRNERGRKPSLQARLQSGMNLQICFMNETSSDSESAPGLDGLELVRSPLSPGSVSSCSSGSSSASSSASASIANSPMKTSSCIQEIISPTVPEVASRPQVLNLPSLKLETTFTDGPLSEADFFARQARLQTEARMALAQAKEMAHMQMEVERQKLKQNPITEMVRTSLQKIGVTLGEERRRLTRALLTELNIAQLQVLANDLHARIATLNEALVEGLLRRDDLHMEQDSMLVDVEDLTRYLGAKQESFKKRQQQEQSLANKPCQPQQQTSRARTLALLSKATSSPRLAAGRQLVVNLVRK